MTDPLAAPAAPNRVDQIEDELNHRRETVGLRAAIRELAIALDRAEREIDRLAAPAAPNSTAVDLIREIYKVHRDPQAYGTDWVDIDNHLFFRDVPCSWCVKAKQLLDVAAPAAGGREDDRNATDDSRSDRVRRGQPLADMEPMAAGDVVPRSGPPTTLARRLRNLARLGLDANELANHLDDLADELDAAPRSGQEEVT
jgi:hypothetical protein